MKNWRLVAGVVVGAAVVAIALLTQQPSRDEPAPRCGVYQADRVVTIGSEKIKAEISDTPAEREKGLSGRPCIESDRGMLFVFERPGTYAIWMKDMKFPIDVLWIDADHKVVGIEINVRPDTYPDRFINKDKPALYVLELPANKAKDLQVTLGTEVTF